MHGMGFDEGMGATTSLRFAPMDGGRGMFPRKLLRYRLRRGVIYPHFLDAGDPEHIRMAEVVVEFYEAWLGGERGRIPFEELIYEVGDDRLAKGLSYAMMHLYQFTPRRAEPGLKMRPLELRLRLFRIVGSTKPGFASDRFRTLKEFIESHRGELGALSPEEVEEYLWSDDPRGFILSRRGGRPSPSEVIRCYNMEVLDTILSNSRMITFSTRGSREMPLGTYVKSLVRMVKELGLIYEGRMHDDLARVGGLRPHRALREAHEVCLEALNPLQQGPLNPQGCLELEPRGDGPPEEGGFPLHFDQRDPPGAQRRPETS